MSKRYKICINGDINSICNTKFKVSHIFDGVIKMSVMLGEREKNIKSNLAKSMRTAEVMRGGCNNKTKCKPKCKSKISKENSKRLLKVGDNNLQFMSFIKILN